MSLKTVFTYLTGCCRSVCVKILVPGAIAALLLTVCADATRGQTPSYDYIEIDYSTGNVTLQNGKVTYLLTEDESIQKADSVSGNFIFNQTGNPVFTNDSGTIGSEETPVGSLDMSATSGFINNGTVYSDGTLSVSSLINSGTLEANMLQVTTDEPDVTATLINTQSGVIQNAESITTGSLINTGLIEMTSDDVRTTTINGDLMMNSVGTLAVRIDPVAGTQPVAGTDNDFYEVNGDVTINGGKVDVKLNGDPTGYRAGDRYNFLSSAGLDEEDTLTLSDQSDPRLRYRLSLFEKNYYIAIARAYGENAPTYNQTQFGSYIDQVSDEAVAGSDLDYVLTRLDALSPPGGDISPAARHAMAQMDGALYGSMATMEIQNMTIVNNTLANYLRPKDLFCSNQCGVSCCQTGGVPSPGLNLWGTWYGTDGYAKGDGNAFGGDYSVRGVLVGSDRCVAPNFRFGGFFAFGNTEYQVNGLREQANADSYKAGLYFVGYEENGYLFGNFNYGWDNFKMTRTISFLERRNTADTSGSEWALRIEKGFNCPLGNTVFQPFGAFQYLSLNTDAFSETGTGTTALVIDEADYQSYRSEFGGRLLWNFAGQCRTGNLFFLASWMHEFGDTCGTVSGSFSNPNQANYRGDNKYTVNGVDLGRDWCNLGIGGDLACNNFTLFGGYDFMLNGRQNLHTGNVGLAYRF